MTPPPFRLLLPLALIPFSTTVSAQISAVCAPAASQNVVPAGGALTLSSNCTDVATGDPIPSGSVNWEAVVNGVRTPIGSSSLPSGTLNVTAPTLPGEVVYQMLTGNAGYGGPISISQLGSENIGASVIVLVSDPCAQPPAEVRQDTIQSGKRVRAAGAACETPDPQAAALGQVSTPLMALQVGRMLDNLGQANQRMRALRARRGVEPLDVQGVPLPGTGKAGANTARPQGFGLYVTGLGAYLRQDGTPTQTEFKSRTSAISVGADHRFNDQWAAGGNIGVSEGRINFTGSSSKQRSKGAQATAYVSWSVSDASYVTAALSYEATRFELTRDDGTRQLSFSKPKGEGLGLSLSAGHDFIVGPWSIGPYVRVDGVNSSVDAFDESGSDAAVSVGAQRLRATVANAGVQAQIVLPVSWGIVTPYLRLEASHRSDKTRKAATATLINGNTPLLLPTATDTSGSYGNVALGVSGVNQGGWSWFVDLESGVSQPGYSSSRIGLGLRREL